MTPTTKDSRVAVPSLASLSVRRALGMPLPEISESYATSRDEMLGGKFSSREVINEDRIKSWMTRVDKYCRQPQFIDANKIRACDLHLRRATLKLLY